MRWSVCIILLTGLLFGMADCYGQSSDSSAAVKPGFLQKIQMIMDRRQQRLEDKAQARWKYRQEHLYEFQDRVFAGQAHPKRWSLSFNPLGFLEPQMAIGLGVGYQVTDHWQLWLESSVLTQGLGSYTPRCVGGVREIFTVKYYLGARRILFLAAEMRWKEVYYRDVYNFLTSTVQPELIHYSYTLKNTVVGGAVWCGARLKLSKDDRWRLEPSVGLGVKNRVATMQGVPAGYRYGTAPPSLEGGNNGDINTSPRVSVYAVPYLPASVRLIYVL
jgi:hypothetical protein